MALQLPGVPFKLTSRDMGVPDITSAVSKGMQLGYQPQLTKAEIFHKTMSPLAAIASNPMLWAMMEPAQQQQMANMISGMMSGYSGGQFGAGGAPSMAMPGASQGAPMPSGGQPNRFPATSGPTPVGAPSYQGEPTNQTDIGSGLVQGASPDTRTGAIAKVTAPYHAQTQPAGVVAYNPKTGQIISTPTESTVSQLQESSLGIKNVIPILNNLADMSKDLLKEGGSLNVARSQLGGTLNQWGVPQGITDIIGTAKMASKNADFIGKQNEAVERLLASLKLPHDQEALQMLKTIVQPQPGENHDGYVRRMTGEINHLYERLQQNQQALFGGLNVTPGQQPPAQPQGLPGSEAVAQQLQPQPEAQPAMQPSAQPAKVSGASKRLSKNLEMPSFNSKDEFQSWYNKQDKMVQDAVRLSLGGK